jgi:two-component system, LytTR family, sensor histidine kinase AlgZ
MSPSQPARPGASTETSPLEDFFIPDLCNPQSVLLTILLAELMVLVYALASSGLPTFNWELFALASLFVQWVSLCSALLLCQSRHLLVGLGGASATLCSLLLITLVTGLSSIAIQELFPPGIDIPESRWWILRNVLIANVLAAIVLRYFYLQQQLRVRERLELQARLDSLRTRIRPHFLFNTLNSIASLIVSRPETAEKAVEDLAELFRASLKENHSRTTVEDELRLTSLYLGIEQLRLGDRLQVEWDVDDSTREAPMPSLILQPLAENAVYHGIAGLPEGGCIRIQIFRHNDQVCASIENPVPDTRSASAGNNMALNNVAQRLEATYGVGTRLETSSPAGHFHVELAYTPSQNS